MDVVTRPSCKPAANLGVFVRRVVIDDEVDIEIGRYVDIDVAEELKEFLVTVTLLALRHHVSCGSVQCGEQGRGPVTNVVVSNTFDIAEAYREHGLRSIEGLNLGLLIHAQNHRVVRGIEVEPDDITHLLNEEGVG